MQFSGPGTGFIEPALSDLPALLLLVVVVAPLLYWFAVWAERRELNQDPRD